MLLSGIRFANLALTAVTAGSYVHDRLAAPAIRSFPGPVYARHHQALDREMRRTFPKVDTAVGLINIAILTLDRNRKGLSFVLASAALASKLVALAYFQRGILPANRTIATRSPEAPPAEWQDVRDRWTRDHTLRTTLGSVTLGCQTGAVTVNDMGEKTC